MTRRFQLATSKQTLIEAPEGPGKYEIQKISACAFELRVSNYHDFSSLLNDFYLVAVQYKNLIMLLMFIFW